MSSKLFDRWTWGRKLPEPFDGCAAVRTDVRSVYNTARAAKSTLHAAFLNAVFAYMDLELDPAHAGGAVGTQGEMIMAEYPSHRRGETHVAVFNKVTGKFIACVSDENGYQTNYVLKENGNSGAALFFVLMPVLLRNDEFSENYTVLLACRKDGFPDRAKAEEAAFILCDNAYRRIEGGASLGDAGVDLMIGSTGNIQPLTSLNIRSRVYTPTSVLMGSFAVLNTEGGGGEDAAVIRTEELCGRYRLGERVFGESERAMIPVIPDWYVVPPEIVSICRHAQATTASARPMRNFMMRGPAGTGKTAGAKAVAAGLGLPYVHMTCSANVEIFDLLGQMLPETEPAESAAPLTDLPSFDDIRFDPASAYEKLTGGYTADVTEETVYEKLIEVIGERTRSAEKNGTRDSRQRFRYVDTPFVKAMRNGWVIEIQEPAVISNPGVLVGLNSLLDRCASVTLPTGELLTRHPETVVVITTNTGYAGCRNLNQSVISRMDLVIDMDEPDAETMAKRVAGITGCEDTDMIRKMAETVKEIGERCRETMISDGCCGVRELISWVQSAMIGGDPKEAARYTVLASVSADPENRAEIENTCILPKFA